MKKTKTGKYLIAMSVLLAVMTSTGICQTNQGGQPKLPWVDIAVGAPAYYAYNENTHVLNITNGIYLGGNISGNYAVRVGWYLSVDNQITTSDGLIGTQSTTLTISPYPCLVDTLTLTVDLDTVTGLTLGDSAIYYVGTIANYDRSISEIAPDSASYSTLYTNNVWCSADPFITGIETLPPTMTSNSPDSGVVNVAVNDTIVIAFSEWMKTANFTWTLLPNPGGLKTIWNIGHDTLRIAHTAFAYATEETLSITHAEDLCGNLLTGRNAFTFTTLSYTGPVITMKTQPSSPQVIAGPYLVQAVITDAAEKGVKSIIADTLYYRVSGGSFIKAGAYAQLADTFSFQIPAFDTVLVEYYLQAWDNTGLSATAPPSGYHSFYVDTLPPAITYSMPDSGATNVALNVQVKIVFSEPMDTASVTFTVVPNPGGVSRSWSTDRDTLLINHNTFAYATAETVSIANVTDLSGNPLSGRSAITFTTLSNQGPIITLKNQPTSPQTIGRPYLVQAMIKDPVKKSAKSIDADSLYYRVNGGPFATVGALTQKGDTFSFYIPAIDSGLVEYYLQAWDNVGVTVIEPSAGYDTFTVNTLPPAITYSTPDSGAGSVVVNAPVMIAFSEPLDTASFTFTMLPDPGGVSGIWNTGHDTIFITHADFAYAITEAVNITHAEDQFGHLLTGRSAITFTTLTPSDPYWDGRFYTPGGLGMNGSVYAITLIDSIVYVGGNFTTAGGDSAKSIAKWNGSNWSALGSGMNSQVSALAVINSSLYAGGAFTTAGGVSAKYIAQWNGSSWSALGSGIPNTDLNPWVSSLAVSGSDLYVGYNYTHYVNPFYLPDYTIWAWKSTYWTYLGSSISPDRVYAIAVIGTDIYAGGSFTYASGVSANRIAKWNGSSWSALGSGLNGTVYALAVIDSNLYAGGAFTTAGGVSANRIAKWNGSSWSALGSGMNDSTRALAARGNNLYVGGRFTTAGGVSANRIAKWDGASWSALGSGTNGTVTALAVTDSAVYAGGNFTTAGGKSSAYFGIYHIPTAPQAVELSNFTCQSASGAVTLSWRTESETGNCAWLIERSGQSEGGYNHIATIPAAGSTPTGQDYAYTDNAVKPGNTYYYKLGDQDLNGKVTWHGPVSSTTAGAGTITALSLLSCSPNPFSTNTTISYQLPKAGPVSLKVYNIAGQVVKTLVEGTQSQGAYHVSWDGRDEDWRVARAGVYFYRLSMAGENILRKLVLVK